MTLLLTLVETSQRVAATSARKGKIRELAGFLRKLQPDEIATVVLYLSGDVPQGRIGIGYSTLRGAAARSTTKTVPLSVPISVPVPVPVPMPLPLSIADVDSAFTLLADIRGAGSAVRRSAALGDLFGRSTAAERDFLIRLLNGELRQGALLGVMVDAIAAAADITVAPVRRAAMYSKSLGAIARTALLDGSEALGHYKLTPLTPVFPMLAQTAVDVAEALTALPGELAFEWKMDGARIQVHKVDDVVRIYTRSLNDVTDALPEIVESVQKFNQRTLVLDGEAITFDAAHRPHPFQITMRRFGRKLNVAALRSEIPIRAYFFDCLYSDGRSIDDLTTRERHAALVQAVPPDMQFPRLVTASEPAASVFYQAALAAGHEGVMAKSLDAPYEAGNRGASWLKIKRAHTLDLVVLAAEWGHGRRTGLLSNLHLGALDPSTGEYVMLGKTFKGLTDAMLAWQTKEFLSRETRREPGVVHIRPELVVEVAFSDLQVSTRYPGGLALRLARVKRYRDDKAVEDADTMNSVRQIAGAASPA